MRPWRGGGVWVVAVCVCHYVYVCTSVCSVEGAGWEGRLRQGSGLAVGRFAWRAAGRHCCCWAAGQHCAAAPDSNAVRAAPHAALRSTIAVLGVDFMSENVRAILDEAGYSAVQVGRPLLLSCSCALLQCLCFRRLQPCQLGGFNLQCYRSGGLRNAAAGCALPFPHHAPSYSPTNQPTSLALCLLLRPCFPT